MISFTPIAEQHIPLMHQWLNQGEVLRWYAHKPYSEVDVRQEYLVKNPTEGTHSFIVELDGEPVGYFQHYSISSFPDFAAEIGAREGDWGIDLFIGEDDRLGKGLGEQMVTTALNKLIFQQEGVNRCILDTDARNKRAIRCYEKCGFRHVKTLEPHGDISGYIMVVDKTPAIKTMP